MHRPVDARDRHLGPELQHALGDVVDDDHVSVENIATSRCGWIVERTESNVSTGAPTSMPAATVACPASTAVSHAGYTGKLRSGRQ